MWWIENPLFNVVVSASEDEGRTWEARSTPAAERPPIDRPWLSADKAGSGRLLLTYRTEGTLVDQVNVAAWVLGQDPPLDSDYRDVFAQVSSDGGRNWSAASKVVETPFGGVHHLQKPVLVGDVLLVPLQHVDFETGLSLLKVARSTDGGRTFAVADLSDPYPSFATFDYSLDADAEGRVVAAWSEPDGSGTNKLHVRTSADLGATWSAIRVLDLGGTQMQPWVALSGSGQVAIAYYGAEAEGSPLGFSPGTPWFAAAIVGPFPLAEESAVAVLSDTVHTGPLCNISLQCPGRSPLREFLSAAWTGNGRLFVAYADAQPPDDAGARIMVARGLLRPR